MLWNGTNFKENSVDTFLFSISFLFHFFSFLILLTANTSWQQRRTKILEDCHFLSIFFLFTFPQRQRCYPQNNENVFICHQLAFLITNSLPWRSHVSILEHKISGRCSPLTELGMPKGTIGNGLKLLVWDMLILRQTRDFKNMSI